MRFVSGESQVRSPPEETFFSSCAQPVLDLPSCCAVNITSDQVLIEFLMFPLQARKPVNQQCGTIANATRGKKVKGLVKLSANVVLAFLRDEIVSDLSKHKVCKSASGPPRVVLSQGVRTGRS